MQILEEFIKTHKFYEKKYKNQTIFKSMKLTTNSSGETEPVFYVGVPGLMVALSFAVVVVATVYLLSIPFKWYIWLPYVIATIFGFRIALKLDKVKQIRYMIYYLLDNSKKLLEKADSEKDKEKKEEMIEKAAEWLEKAQEWVYEPAVEAQLELIRKS